MNQKTMKLIEQKLGLKFNHPGLLRNAFTHRSYLNEHPGKELESNERLEFLGDAVLELIVSLLLYHELPGFPEGKLTNIRSLLVRTTTLAEFTSQLKLGEHLLMSKGEKELGGHENISLLANLFEAIIGAIYLDQGYEKAAEFGLPQLTPKLKEVIKKQSFKDAKSLFQEFIQEQQKITPEYRVIDEKGPDHAKTFTVSLRVGETEWATGQGRSKQEAEEGAAVYGLKKLAQAQPNRLKTKE